MCLLFFLPGLPAGNRRSLLYFPEYAAKHGLGHLGFTVLRKYDVDLRAVVIAAEVSNVLLFIRRKKQLKHIFGICRTAAAQVV